MLLSWWSSARGCSELERAKVDAQALHLCTHQQNYDLKVPKERLQVTTIRIQSFDVQRDMQHGKEGIPGLRRLKHEE